MKVQNIDSYKKGIIYSSGFNLLSKLLIFAQNMILAYLFGTHVKVDIFFYAITTISLITQFITLLNGYVILPESMQIRHSKGNEDSMKFLNVFLYGYILLGVLFTSLVLISPIDVVSTTSNFSPQVLQEYKTLLVLAVPMFMFMIVVNYLVDLLSSYKYFTAPQRSKMINSIFTLTFLFAFYKWLDIKSIILGYYAGYIINIIILVVIMKKELKWNFKFKFYPIEKRILTNSLYAQGGNITTILANYYPIYLLSGFSAGSIASLNYGQQVANLPTNSITQQFSPVIGIRFNELYATKDYDKLNKTFTRSTNILLFILMAVSAITLIYNTEIIRILYERGKFDSSSTAASAAFLSIFILSVPFVAINNMVSRIFMSGHKIKQYFWYQVIKNIIMIALTYIFIKKIGVLGFPVSWLIVNVLNIPACQYQMWLSFRFVNFKPIIISIIKVIILNAIAALPVLGFNWLFPGMNIYLKLLIGGTIFISTLLSLNYFFKVNIDISENLFKYYNKIKSKILKKPN
jgi:putative peptidoglycan lipid II flippase